MISFALLASGSKGNSFLLKSSHTTLLVDCGSTKKHLEASFAKLGIQIEDLDALCITHQHSDHIAQINMFKDVPIYSPIPIDEIKVNLIEPYQAFVIGDITITPLALSHDAGTTVGYIFEEEEKLVYLTDTGYVSQRNQQYMYDADYIILESNHDIEMLMETSRPQYIKSRIYGESGHLCNEDCASILAEVISNRTKMIILAHLSQQANTREKALLCSKDVLCKCDDLHKDLVLCVSEQYEMIRKGVKDEEMDLGTCWCAIGMESVCDSTTDSTESTPT